MELGSPMSEKVKRFRTTSVHAWMVDTPGMHYTVASFHSMVICKYGLGKKNMVHIAQIKASNVGRVNNINKHHGKHDAIMMQTWCKHVAMVLPKPSTTIATTTTAMITTPGYFSCISNSIIIHHGRWSGWWWRYPMGTSHLQMSHFGGQTHCWGYTHWCLQCEVFWLHSEWWLKHAAWVCFCDKSFLFVFPSFLSCT